MDEKNEYRTIGCFFVFFTPVIVMKSPHMHSEGRERERRKTELNMNEPVNCHWKELKFNF